MRLSWAWVQRRFWDFRRGHSTYLAYAISFINFIVLNYKLLITNVDVLVGIFPHLWIFAVSFLITYPILAVNIGYFLYRKRQFHTDINIGVEENPYLWKAQPGRDKQLSLPLQLRSLQIALRWWEKEGVLTAEDRVFYKHKMAVIQRLIDGKSLPP